MSEQIRELIRIRLSDGKGHQAKDIKNFIIESEVKASSRTIEYEITDLVEGGEIRRDKPKGSRYTLYFLVLDDPKKSSSHRLYIMGTKGHMFFWQAQIADIIERNYLEYKYELKKDISKNSSLITNTIINFLWLHKKLAFAELSNWFGNSKSELTKAKKNRMKIDTYVNEMFSDALRTKFEIWHSMVHAVHDIIDEERILTKSQIKKLWSA